MAACGHSLNGIAQMQYWLRSSFESAHLQPERLLMKPDNNDVDWIVNLPQFIEEILKCS